MTSHSAGFNAARILGARKMSAGDMRARMNEMWTQEAIAKWERIRLVAGIITGVVTVMFFFIVPQFLAVIACAPLVYLGYEIMRTCTNILKMADQEELRPDPIQDGLPGLIERIAQHAPLTKRALTFYYEAKHPKQMGIFTRSRLSEMWNKKAIESWELTRIIAGIVVVVTTAFFFFMAPKLFALLICAPYLYLGYEAIMVTTNTLKLAHHEELRPDIEREGLPKLIERITQNTFLAEKVLTFYYKAKHPAQMQGP
jgi:hypothetical protein